MAQQKKSDAGAKANQEGTGKTAPDTGEFPDHITKRLNEKFRLKDVEWVVVNAYDYTFGQKHVVNVYAQPYIKKEAAEMRADQVLGHRNWENDFSMPDSNGRFKYVLRARTGEESPWIPRRAAGSLDQNASGGFASDAFEIAASYAEKRAWSKLGVGRYLRQVPQTECQVSGSYKDGWNRYTIKSKVKGKKIKIYWRPPQLPEWAMHPDDSYEDINQGEDPDMPGDGQKEPQQAKRDKAPASKKHWKMIDAYFTNIPDDEQDKWDDVLFKDEIENGEIVGKKRRKISAGFAGKIINKMIEGYGELNDNGVPSDIAEIKEKRGQPPEKK